MNSLRAQSSKEDEGFFANTSYPVRREGMPDPSDFYNSRQSLSNTISRVAHLLSPARDDTPASIYRGARRNRPSFMGASLGSQLME